MIPSSPLSTISISPPPPEKSSLIDVHQSTITSSFSREIELAFEEDTQLARGCSMNEAENKASRSAARSRVENAASSLGAVLAPPGMVSSSGPCLDHSLAVLNGTRPDNTQICKLRSKIATQIQRRYVDNCTQHSEARELARKMRETNNDGTPVSSLQEPANSLLAHHYRFRVGVVDITGQFQGILGIHSDKPLVWVLWDPTGLGHFEPLLDKPFEEQNCFIPAKLHLHGVDMNGETNLEKWEELVLYDEVNVGIQSNEDADSAINGLENTVEDNPAQLTPNQLTDINPILDDVKPESSFFPFPNASIGFLFFWLESCHMLSRDRKRALLKMLQDPDFDVNELTNVSLDKIESYRNRFPQQKPEVISCNQTHILQSRKNKSIESNRTVQRPVTIDYYSLTEHVNRAINNPTLMKYMKFNIPEKTQGPIYEFYQSSMARNAMLFAGKEPLHFYNEKGDNFRVGQIVEVVRQANKFYRMVNIL